MPKIKDEDEAYMSRACYELEPMCPECFRRLSCPIAFPGINSYYTVECSGCARECTACFLVDLEVLHA